MAQTAIRLVQRAVEHVLAVLQEDLPADLRARIQAGDYLPGLLGQLPFISVSAETPAARTIGLGGKVKLKRDRVDNVLVDLGEVSGDSGECRFTLTLWALTRPQLEQLRAAVQEMAWTRREVSWEAPPNILNRTIFPRCWLASISASAATPLPHPPPNIIVQANTLTLRASPSDSSQSLGQAKKGDQFELLGRSQDSVWVQGCGPRGEVVWMRAQSVDLSVPLSVVPEIGGTGAAPAGGIELAPTSTPATTVWRQDLLFAAYLEATQEPTVTPGERITEIRITRQLGTEEQVLDTERTRLLADHEEVVEEFPP